jgi:hypothetical protein
MNRCCTSNRSWRTAGRPSCWQTQLLLRRLNDNWVARGGQLLPLGALSCDVPNVPGDRNRLKGVRCGELL